MNYVVDYFEGHTRMKNEVLNEVLLDALKGQNSLIKKSIATAKKNVDKAKLALLNSMDKAELALLNSYVYKIIKKSNILDPDSHEAAILQNMKYDLEQDIHYTQGNFGVNVKEANSYDQEKHDEMMKELKQTYHQLKLDILNLKLNLVDIKKKLPPESQQITLVEAGLLSTEQDFDDLKNYLSHVKNMNERKIQF